MKIAWVTPFALRSSIGRVSAEVTRVLASRGHQVEILRCEAENDPQEPLHPTRLPIHHWRDYPLDRLDTEFDLVVVNIGDNYPFHAGVFPVLDAARCLGVFHDFYLYNLFSGWLHHNHLDHRRHDAEIIATYGADIADDAVATRSGQRDIAQIAERLPMAEWLAARCAGALAHARFYAPRLEAACPGPVTVQPLCCPDRANPPAPAVFPKPTGDRLTLTTVGVMNANKRVADILKALGGSALLRDCVYRLVGPISAEEQMRLETLSQDVGFSGLEIDGAVDDDQLDRRLAEADIICCLRKPVLEGASGSAIEGMLSGRPTVVARAGFYGELPDDLVFKVDGEIDIVEIRAVLERLAGDAELRLSTGRAARAWALETLNAERYVDGLEMMARAMVLSRPLEKIAGRVGEELKALELGEDDPAVGRIGATLQRLFAPLTA